MVFRDLLSHEIEIRASSFNIFWIKAKFLYSFYSKNENLNLLKTKIHGKLCFKHSLKIIFISCFHMSCIMVCDWSIWLFCTDFCLPLTQREEKEPLQYINVKTIKNILVNYIWTQLKLSHSPAKLSFWSTITPTSDASSDSRGVDRSRKSNR